MWEKIKQQLKKLKKLPCWSKFKSDSKPRPRNKSSIIRDFFLGLLLIHYVAGIFNNYHVKPIGEISYSQFLENVENGNIKHITVLDHTSTLNLRTEKPIETIDYTNAKERLRRLKEQDNLTWVDKQRIKFGLIKLEEEQLEKYKEIFQERRYFVKYSSYAQFLGSQLSPLSTKKIETSNGEIVIPVKDGVEIEVKGISPTSKLIMTILGFIPNVLIILVIFYVLVRMQEGSGIMSNAKSEAVEVPKDLTLNDVRGIEEHLKREITEILDFIKQPERYKKFAVKCPKGILMVGPPGVGKTLLAKAMAAEANVPFFYRSGSDLENPYVGMSAQTVRNLFKAAKKHEKAIIFIDEIDAVGSRSGIQQHNTGLVNALLTEMDGFEDASGIIVIAATNNPDKLDEALLREGRFDRQVSIPLPSETGRRDILSYYVNKHTSSLSPEVDINVLAKLTVGYSGAALAALINEAAIEAIRENQNIITQAHIMQARDKKIMGVPFLNFSQSSYQREVTAYHEAGHAVVAWLFEKGMELYKVSILPRSNSLGVTVSVPLEEKHNYSKTELLSRLKVLYAGRAAEEVFFDEITTGASNDIEVATSIAQRMLTEFGMNEEIGMQKITKEMAMAKKVDDLRTAMLSSLYKETVNAIKANKEKVELIAQALLEKEEISSEEIKQLLGKPQTKKGFSVFS